MSYTDIADISQIPARTAPERSDDDNDRVVCAVLRWVLRTPGRSAADAEGMCDTLGLDALGAIHRARGAS